MSIGQMLWVFAYLSIIGTFVISCYLDSNTFYLMVTTILACGGYLYEKIKHFEATYETVVFAE